MNNNYLITGYWGEPHVTAENDRGINAAMFGTGRFVLPVGEQFRAEYIGNNTIRMYDGKLIDNGAAAGIPAGEYVDLLIANAGQGMKRNDLIIFQYEQDASTLIESGKFVVIQGTETSGAASDPELTQEDLLGGNATFDQMALWRVSVSGASVAAPVKVFPVSANLSHISGKQLTADDDINTILNNGVYWWADAPKNAPMTYCVMRTWFGVGEYCVQEVITGNIYHDNVIMRRFTKTGASGWQPWEYVNPPMITGEEYRTTERWNNKPVYTILLDCGVTSTRTSVNAPAGATRLIRHTAWCNHKLLPLADYIVRNSYYAYTSVDVDGLTVWYNGDSKSDGFGSGKEHWFVQLWYTKD